MKSKLEVVEEHLCDYKAVFRTGCGCERSCHVDEPRDIWEFIVSPYPEVVHFHDAEEPSIRSTYKTRRFKLNFRDGRTLYYREVTDA